MKCREEVEVYGSTRRCRNEATHDGLCHEHARIVMIGTNDVIYRVAKYPAVKADVVPTPVKVKAVSRLVYWDIEGKKHALQCPRYVHFKDPEEAVRYAVVNARQQVRATEERLEALREVLHAAERYVRLCCVK